MNAKLICGTLAALTTALLGAANAALADWSPPAWSYEPSEISTMPTVVLVMAGKTLPLRFLPNAPSFGPKSVWSADYGIFSPQGDYTAPPFLPLRGEDTLTFSNPANPAAGSLHFIVRILPNPKIPGSQFTPFNYMPGPNDPYRPPGEWPPFPIILTPPAKMPPHIFLRRMAVVERGKKPALPDELTAIHPLPVVTAAGVRGYRLPVRDAADSAVTYVYVPVGLLNAPLRTAKELPTFTGTPYTNPDPRMPRLGKGGSRTWQTWRAPCP